MSTTPQNIVIVGGGHAGLAAWNALSTTLDATKHNLVLVTPRPYFTYMPAGLRLAVTSEGHLEDTVLMPLGEKFNTGNKKLVIASVTSIVDQNQQGGHIVLDNGEKIEYSILILAPGNKWDGPLNLPNTKAEAVEVLNSWRSRFAKAENIVLVGGGAVGLELAGEIKDLGAEKNVTIVHSQSLYLNDTYPESWRKYVGKQFASRGVTAVLGEYIDDLEIKDGYVTTRSGKKIAADLVVPTRGGGPNTKFVASLGPDVLTTSGTIKVGPTLQLVNHPRIFAAGDVVDWNEQKQAIKAAGHVNVIATNVLVLLELSKKKPVLYKGAAEMIVITNGKNGGTGYFAVLWGITVGNWLASVLKSKTLMVDKARKALAL
ncbi:FAD/NAD(P)-binding domain-containing protein [Pholiota conissans]|uniref:FAD/NAD(P)-binding domain-containing protein n=1 Tax=Pholiota conissans TaxID=109636 RepID=A0A9P5YM45_9AGAR|nr:FAD/NAD(P)-binding domain-containing protein [Pholiota conissans]